MGLIKPSSLIANLGGKFGGQVIQGGRSGIIVRNNQWRRPQQFPKWQTQKACLAFTAQNWRLLTQPQRDAWEAMTPSYPATNRFGDTYIPSGFQLYMTLNMTLFCNFGGGLLVPLAPQVLFDSGVNTLVALSPWNLTVSITNSMGASDGIVIYAHRPISAGSQFRDGGFSKMRYESDPVATSFDITDNYNSKFGVAPPGSLVWTKVESIRNTTGQSGNLQYASDIVP